MSAMLETALSYAARGWAVFPLHHPTQTERNGRSAMCSCGKTVCDSVGKHPHYHKLLVPNGVKDATTDAARIREWWGLWPAANIAIATGAVSGLLVLDVDGSAGRVSLDALEASHGLLPLGPAVATGGGGTHFYFAHPSPPVPPSLGGKGGIRIPNSAGQLGVGLDVRGDDGYVVAPPSLHATGAHYTWQVTADMPLPQPVSWLIPRRQKAEGGKQRREGEGLPSASGFLPTIPEGQRNASLFKAAVMAAKGGASAAGVLALTEAENTTRCQPPLAEAEVERIVASALRYPPADAVHTVPPMGLDVVTPPVLPVHRLPDLVAATPAQIDWLAGPWIGRGLLTELAGKPKLAGKTTWALAMCRAVLTGADFMGQPTHRTGVMYLTEQSQVSFIQSADRARVTQDPNFNVVLWDEVQAWRWPDMIAAVAQMAREREAGLLIVDTLSQFVGIYGDDENNAGTALAALAPLKLACSLGLGVLVIRHERKAGGDIGEASRGSTAFVGVFDTILSMRQGEGGGRDTQRVIKAYSRLSDVPRQTTVELVDGEYIVHGATSVTQAERASAAVVDHVPVGRDKALPLSKVQAACGYSRPVVQKALYAAMEGGLVKRDIPGGRGSQYLYYRTGAAEGVLTSNPIGGTL